MSVNKDAAMDSSDGVACLSFGCSNSLRRAAILSHAVEEGGSGSLQPKLLSSCTSVQPEKI